MRDTEMGWGWGEDIGRRRSRLPAGSPMWDLTLGPQDHYLSQRQMLNQWNHPGIPTPKFLISTYGLVH